MRAAIAYAKVSPLRLRNRRKPDLQSTAPIGFLLQRAHNILRDRLIEVLDGTGINLGHVAILGSLTAENGLTQKRLSEHTGIEKSSMVNFLDALERDGWVTRTTHPTDRRAHLVQLTLAGARRFSMLGPRLQEVEADFLSSLHSSERAQLASLLQKLTQTGR